MPMRSRPGRRNWAQPSIACFSFAAWCSPNKVSCRRSFEQGVAWINITRYKQLGKLRTEFYAEGKVRIDDGSVIRDYPRTILDLTTRGEFKVHAHRVPLVRQSRAKIR